MPIAARIVQTNRHEGLAQASRDSWMACHPDFEYCFYDDAACRHLMATRCPDLLATYDRFPLAVQKADMFRYAAIYLDGGIYADTDTRCCASFDTYASRQLDALVVGIEMRAKDYKRVDDYINSYPVPHQLTQWTFAASARHPALAIVLRRIVWYVSLMTDAQLAEWSKSMRFTIELTAGIQFTQVCNEFLSGTREGTLKVLARLTWGSWPFEQERPELAAQIKVKHLFEGSWKNDHDRLPQFRAGATTPSADALPAAGDTRMAH